ncbi:MAG TPA: hypothetical protein PKG95_13535 [Anaerolineaceae bacterium]|nr:hypothetical protein [Anaerolineaceae bacterium]
MTTETEHPLIPLPPFMQRVREKLRSGWQDPRRRVTTVVLVILGTLLLVGSCGLLIITSFGGLPSSIDSPFEDILVGNWQLAADSPRPGGYDVELRFEENGRLWLVDRATGQGLSASYAFVAEKRVNISVTFGLPAYDFEFDYDGTILSVITPPDLGFGTIYFVRVAE